MKEDLIIEKLENIEKMLFEQNLLKKEVLDFNEACQYLKISASHLYKLTSTKSIPHYCPSGKKLYFERHKLDLWRQRNPQITKDELEKQVDDYLIKKGKIV